MDCIILSYVILYHLTTYPKHILQRSEGKELVPKFKAKIRFNDSAKFLYSHKQK